MAAVEWGVSAIGKTFLPVIFHSVPAKILWMPDFAGDSRPLIAGPLRKLWLQLIDDDLSTQPTLSPTQQPSENPRQTLSRYAPPFIINYSPVILTSIKMVAAKKHVPIVKKRTSHRIRDDPPTQFNDPLNESDKTIDFASPPTHCLVAFNRATSRQFSQAGIVGPGY